MSYLKNKTLSKSITYYISEIAIVIIGIFIAIQLNNLNEYIKDKKEEKKSIHRILNDLKTEKIVMNNYKKRFIKNKKKLIDIIYNDKTDNLDSIGYFFEPFHHYKMNSEYISLKYSGKLNLIKNDTTRNNLIRYYELYYEQYDFLSKKHLKMIEDGIGEYFVDIASDTTNLVKPSIIKSKLKDIKFRNLIIDQINALTGINKKLRIDLIDKIIERIERTY